MIFVKGYGQMCNNWLQYAHTYVWGRENGVRTVPMRFSYKYRYFHVSDKWYHNFLTYLIAKLLIKTHAIACLWFQEPEPVTDAVLRRLRSARIIAIDGWGFRHPDLLMKYREELLSLFAFRPSETERIRNWLAALPEADVRLGLHIRRGDYARWMNGAYYFEDDVYADMIRQFAALHPGKRVQVLVATNDPKTDLGVLRGLSGVQDVRLIGGNPCEDLFALSECDCIIGPKSTFSLVAAFYHDIPLYWMAGKNGILTKDSFCKFESLFMSV